MAETNSHNLARTFRRVEFRKPTSATRRFDRDVGRRKRRRMIREFSSNFSSSVLIIKISVPNSGGMLGSSYNSSTCSWVIAILMSISLDLFSNHCSHASFAPLRMFLGTLGSSIWLITVAICPNLVSMSDIIHTCTKTQVHPSQECSFKVRLPPPEFHGFGGSHILDSPNRPILGSRNCSMAGP